MRLVLPQWLQGGGGSVNGSAHLVQYGSRTGLVVWHFGQLISLVTRRRSRSTLISRAEKYRSLTSSARLIWSNSKNQRCSAGTVQPGSANWSLSSRAVWKPSG